MLEGSDLLIEQKGYLFSSIFIFREAAHIVRTLLGGGYLKSVQGGGEGGGSKFPKFERTYFLNGPFGDSFDTLLILSAILLPIKSPYASAVF